MQEDEYGPPTPEDDAWFTHAVVSLGYPKVKRDPEPMVGQLTMYECPPDNDVSGVMIDPWPEGVRLRVHDVLEFRPDGVYLNGEKVER